VGGLGRPVVTPGQRMAPGVRGQMAMATVRPGRVGRGGGAARRPVSQGQRRGASATRGRRAASEIRKARPAAAGITAVMRAAAAPATVVPAGLWRVAGVGCMAVLLGWWSGGVSACRGVEADEAGHGLVGHLLE